MLTGSGDGCIKVLFCSCQGGPANIQGIGGGVGVIGILKYCFVQVREVQQIFRVWEGDDVWVGDDRDIKVLFCSCQGGPTNIQGVGGG